MITVRLAQASDLPELAILFRQTVLANAPQRYTSDQTKTWASLALNEAHFNPLILGATTYLAVEDTRILGFAGIRENGYIASTYVRHDCTRQGIGSLLMNVLLDHASREGMQRLYAEASEFSLGLFTKFGFRLYDTEVVDRNGIQFKRYLVERAIGDRVIALK